MDCASHDFQLGDLHCSLLKTGDGSYSLRYQSLQSNIPFWTEPMHSSQGAWSETLFVYSPALHDSLHNVSATEVWNVTSIGLGLGYNELLCAALALNNKRPVDKVKLHSYESEAALKRAFRLYFSQAGDASKSDLPEEMVCAYQHTLDLVCETHSLPESAFRPYVRELLESRALEMHSAVSWEQLQKQQPAREPSHCLLFDAFSPESSPELWTESTLHALIGAYCGPACVFASYASRTSLKRALKAHGFKLLKSRGYAGKRERTFATR